MDIISHGFWGGIAFGRRAKQAFLITFWFGVLPDLFAFSFVFVKRLFGGEFIKGPIEQIPDYVHGLYNVSHSLVVAAAALLICLMIWRGRAWVVAAWPLHILFDMFTHDLRFFPTPFLWPGPTPFISGIPWSTPWVFFMNWGALGGLYIVWFIIKHKEKNK